MLLVLITTHNGITQYVAGIKIMSKFKYFTVILTPLLLLIISCSKSTSSEDVSFLGISVKAVPEGSGTLPFSNREVEVGSEVEILATPNSGWHFVEWKGTQEGTDNPLSLTVNDDEALLAVFEKSEYDLTVETVGEGTVIESIYRTKSTSYEDGTQVLLSAEPDSGWKFDHWEGDLNGQNPNEVVDINDSKSITAHFVKRTYPLEIEIIGLGRVEEEVISGDTSSYSLGTEVELNAIPDSGWYFKNWSLDYNSVENPISVRINYQLNIKANFVTNPTIGIIDLVSKTDKKFTITFNLVDSGKSEVIDMGVCISQIKFPNNQYECKNVNVSYEPQQIIFNNLKNDEQYYYRAYAKNDFGIGYSEQYSNRTYPFLSEIVAIGDPLGFSLPNYNSSLLKEIDLNESNFSIVTAGITHEGRVIQWENDYYDFDFVIPENLNNVKMISTSYLNVFALLTDGSLVAWGYNESDIAQEVLNIPNNISNIDYVQTGGKFVIALKNDGTLIGWGDNSQNQLNYPSDLQNVKKISTMFDNTIALKNDGTLVGWGEREDINNIPSGLVDIVDVSVGGRHAIALSSDGTVYAWGDNCCGQLDIPEELTDIIRIDAGRYHNVAIDRNGKVFGWGSNDRGQINFADDYGEIVDFEAGDNHTLILRKIN